MHELMFEYNDGLDDIQNSMVVAFNELVRDFRANKSNTKEYKENNKQFTESIVKYSVEQAGKKYTDLSMVKNAQLSLNNTAFTENFATNLAQVLTPTIPEVMSGEFNNLWDVQQVGWGNNAKYEVASNEYFLIYDIAEGVQRQNRQTMYNTEYTVQARPKQISVAVDWYKVSAGVFDFGQFGTKIAVSYRSYLQLLTVKGMLSVVTNRNTLGIGGYYKVGATTDNWIDLAQKVSAANGGADVYALGTLSALSKIVPDDAGFRFTSDDDLVTQGFLPVFKQVPCVEMKQAIIPTTLNGTDPKLAIPDDYIYFLPLGFNKPVKVVFEGENIVVSVDRDHSKDHTLSLTITMHIGCDVIVGTKFGILDVSND